MNDEKKDDSPEQGKAESKDEKVEESASTPEPEETEKEGEKEEKAEEEAIEEAGKPKDLIEDIEKLSVLELADLVKALEDRFGVTAAAPVAVTAGAVPSTSG